MENEDMPINEDILCDDECMAVFKIDQESPLSGKVVS